MNGRAPENRDDAPGACAAATASDWPQAYRSTVRTALLAFALLVVLAAVLVAATDASPRTDPPAAPQVNSTKLLDLDSEPSGAAVFIDGVHRGQTPLRALRVPNDAVLELRHARHRTLRRHLHLDQNVRHGSLRLGLEDAPSRPER